MESVRNKSAIGTAKIKDIPAFREWFRCEGRQKGSDRLSGWHGSHWRDYFYERQQLFSGVNNIYENSYLAEDMFFQMEELDKYGISFNLYFDDGFAAVIGYGENKYLLPSEWITIKPLEDLSDIPVGSLTALTGETIKDTDDSVTTRLSVLPRDMDSALTVRSVKENIKKQNAELEALQEYEKKLKSHDLPEFAEINAKLEKLQAELKAIEAAKMAELEKLREEFQMIKAELEKKLFLLETCIYGIRCYTGEVVKVAQLTSGRQAPEEEPVVLYAKVRFLDEELGKYLSLYNFGDYENEQEVFMEALKSRADLQELLAPGDKSISVIKSSRSGRCFAQSGKAANMLKSYEKLHGKQVAILIRNGECIYISWLDEEKINLSDENFIYEARQTVRPYDENDAAFIRTPTKEEIASRYFLVQVLNGILQHGNILSLPEKGNVLTQGKYIVYSMASGWLKDTRYGTFGDIIKKASANPPKKGDKILTLLRVTRDDIYERRSNGCSSEYESWNNDRGIGDRNRTAGLSVKSLAIYDINLVVSNFLFTVPYKREYYKCIDMIKHDLKKTENGESYYPEYIYEETPFKTEENHIHREVFTDLKEKPTLEKELRGFKRVSSGVIPFSDNVKAVNIYEMEHARLEEIEPDIYVSLKKEQWDSSKKAAYANFLVEKDEYLPLTFLCSEWIDYIITTGQVSGFRLPGTREVDLASALTYLNIIKEHLREREVQEKELITSAIEKQGSDIQAQLENVMSTTLWTMHLSEWKLKNDIHKLHSRNVSQFLKYLIEQLSD